MTSTAGRTAGPSENRTLGHAVMDVRYAIEYGELHEKLWSHIDTGISLVQIAAGALALAGVLTPGRWLTAAAGITLAVLSSVQLCFKPRERSIEFRDTRRKLHDLNANAWSMSLQDVDRALEQIKSEAPRGLDALARPAQNRVLASNGYPNEVEPLKTNESILSALA